MTIDDRLREMRAERTHLIALMGRKNGFATLAKHFNEYERAIRLLIEQRDMALRRLHVAVPRIPEDGSASDWIWDDNAALIEAMDG